MPAGMFDIDEHLGWKLKTGKSGIHHSHYFEVVYAINSLGFRDQARKRLKDENIYRILLYGDSEIFGWAFGKETVFPI